MCEKSGMAREAFRALGHDAWSCDIEPSEDNSPFHIIIDGTLLAIEKIIALGWDFMLAHPPCTYLCNSGVHLLYRSKPRGLGLVGEVRRKAMHEAAVLFRFLWNADVPRIAIENPIMHKYAKELIGIGKADCVIQPFQFGHAESKATCFWLRNVPPLQPTNILPKPECGYWSNQTPSGQNKLGGGLRATVRARTYRRVAEAMAVQWGRLGPYVKRQQFLVYN